MPINVANLQDAQLVDIQDDLAQLNVVELLAFLRVLNDKSGLPLLPVLSFGQPAAVASPLVKVDDRSTNLGVGAAWIGNQIDMSRYAALVGFVVVDVAGTLDFQWNFVFGEVTPPPGDTNWAIMDSGNITPDPTLDQSMGASYAVGAGGGNIVFRVNRIAPWMRVKYTNGAIATTTFRSRVYGSTV